MPPSSAPDRLKKRLIERLTRKSATAENTQTQMFLMVLRDPQGFTIAMLIVG